jgi:hypothetical protein
MSDRDGPEQEALFYIEGPDERGCVWMHGANSSDPWAQNLGPADKVAEVLSAWLTSIDYDEPDEFEKGSKEQQSEEEKRKAKRLRKLARPADHRDHGGQG